MESLKEFFYKVIFHEEPRDIPLNIDTKKKDICMICKSVIDPSLKDSVTILSCKHFYHEECIGDTCPLCQEQTNRIENASIYCQKSSCSINSLLNLEHANISTSLTEFTEPMFTESIEPTEPTFTEFTEPTFTESTEPTFTKSTESTKLIESIESTESNSMLVKFTELTTSFILVEYTESIASVDSTDFTSAPIESIEYAEASKPTKSKTTKSKAISKKIQMIQLLRELNTP
ncbi:6874_t:CDS:1, partial [Racocetra persica]